MTKTILLTLTLLSCTAWMAAQSTPQTSTPDSSAQSGAQSSAQAPADQAKGDETTIQGCLTSSGSNYILTDASGTQYQLQGDTSKLSSNVNNQVQVKGTAGAGAGSAGATATSSGAGAGQSFTVSKVKKVSGSCNAAK